MDTIEQLKQLKNKIALAFSEFGDAPAAPEAPEPVTGKLKTGEDFRAVPALEQGASLSVLSAEGELPAPDGEHELEDGTIVTVVEGLITSLVPPPAAPTPEAVAMSEEITALKSENEALKNEIKEKETIYDARFKEIEGKLVKQLEFSALLNEAFEVLAKEPAVEATQAPNTAAVQLSATDWRKQAQEKLKKSAKIDLKTK